MLYLLVKGINGFGNMISVLSVVYDLAQKSNRTLVIDWSHPEWRLGFSRYFKFKDGIKYMEYDEFIKTIGIKKNIRVYPECFKNKLNNGLIDLFPNIDSIPNEYQRIFGKIPEMVNLKKIDVCVFSYNYCGFDLVPNLFGNINLNDELKLKIREKIKNINSKYKSIHIRHTDIKNDDLTWVYNFIDTNTHIQIYVATDSESLLDELKSKYSNIINYTTFYERDKPLHIQQLTVEEKNIVNEDLISDLILLINADELKITPIKTRPWMTTYSMLAMILFMNKIKLI